MLDWAKCFSVSTDGAPSMIGCRKGFAAHAKKVDRSVQVIHCTLHRENLASRELSAALHDVVKYVLQIIACFKRCVHHVDLRTNRYYFIPKAGGCHAAKFASCCRTK